MRDRVSAHVWALPATGQLLLASSVEPHCEVGVGAWPRICGVRALCHVAAGAIGRALAEQ